MEKRNKKSKVIAVLFSSGLDSTYLVHKNLKEGNTVHPIYVEIKNNENKCKVEKQNINMLYKIFSEKFPDKIKPPRIVTEISVNSNQRDLIFVQIPIWIFGMMYTPYLSEYDEIHIGYVSNDDAVSYLEQIRDLYNSHKWLVGGKKRLPKLLFPLSQVQKYTMMEELPHEYKPFITSCEEPILKPYYIKLRDERMQFYEPCGRCVACKRIIRDELAYNDQYRKIIENHHKIMSLGRRFSTYQEQYPEKFKKFEDDLYAEEVAAKVSEYAEIDMATEVGVYGIKDQEKGEE